MPEPIGPFNPNDGQTPAGAAPTMLLPRLLDDTPAMAPRDAAEYVRLFSAYTGAVALSGPEQELVKAGTKSPPTAINANQIAFLPDPQSNGIIEWPGMNPLTLKKIARENIAPQLIIGMRCADVQRYSTLSNKSWKPGWRIELMEGDRAPTPAERKDMREAEIFLANSCIDLGLDDALERDKRRYSSFANFLDMATRDTLTYAQIALWKDTDIQGRVKAYALLPASNVRQTGMYTPDGKLVIGGYKGDPDIATALVSDSHEIIGLYRRDELTFFPRNLRTDVDTFGYGWPEIEQALRLITGYQNAVDMNLDTFTKSAIPNGILVIKGGQVTQKQLDLLNRMWTDLKKGVTKNWALPVISLNQDSTIEIIDMSRMKGNEGYYKEFINMLAGALCILWKFPVTRLGYKTSGANRDTQPLPDSSTNEVDADDPGLAPLLIHLEELINPYLIWTRWPHLKFFFCGKNPKENMREYEARRNSMTLREARAEADLPSLEETYKGGDKDVQLAMKFMDAAPIDPGMAGIYQAISAAIISAKMDAQEPKPNAAAARIQPKKDPAKSEAHGAVSGVRRDSAAESKT